MELAERDVEELKNNAIYIAFSSVEKGLDFCRSNSIWPVAFGLACCAIEMMAAGGARYPAGRWYWVK